MKKLSNTGAELKKSVAFKKNRVLHNVSKIGMCGLRNILTYSP